MKRYYYKARNPEGKIVTGEVEASNENHAAKLVRERKLTVISISPVHEGITGFIRSLRDRITTGTVATFTRQLSTMITAGLPITEALLILRNQTKGAMQKVISQLLADVEGGESLSKSLSKHPK